MPNYVDNIIMPTGESVLVMDSEGRKNVKRRPKKAVLIGDSYSRGVGASDNNGWPYYLQQLIPDAEFTLVGNSGAGFTASGHSDGLSGMKFIDQLEKAANDLGEATADVDTVLCCGGWNDHGNGSNADTVEPAVTSFVNKAFQLFPNAIVYVYPLSSNRIDLGALSNCNYSIYNAATEAGAVSSANSWQWLMDGTDNTAGDGIHPNAVGYALIGRRLMGEILGNEQAMNTRLGNGFAYGDGITGTFRCGVQNGFAFMCGKLSTKSTPNGNTHLGTLPYIMQCDDQDVYIPCQYYQTDSDGIKDVVMLHPYGVNSNYPGELYITTPIGGSWGTGPTDIYVPPTVWPIGRS